MLDRLARRRVPRGYVARPGKGAGSWPHKRHNRHSRHDRRRVNPR